MPSMVQLAGLLRDPRAQGCIHIVLKGWADSVGADLQSQGQVDMNGSELEESTGQSWSRPPA